jgi:hypothetical protein
MTVDRIFLGYMVLAGVAAGAILVAAPGAQDFFIKPYFWVLLAIVLFDVGVYLQTRNTPATMLTMCARLFGFVIGIVLMVAIPTFAGSPVRFY